MKLIKAHKIKLNPTKTQKVLMDKSFGCARHSYNWALVKWKELYLQGEKPSAYSMIKLQNKIKREEMPFYMEVTKCAVQYAIHNLESAFKKMWKEGAKYPKFKKKGKNDSYVAVENKTQFKQKDYKIRLPRIGWVKCFENLRFEGKVNNVTIKKIAGMYFAIVNVEVSTPHTSYLNSENQAIVGIDLGVKTLMTLSDGTCYENPKALEKNFKSLKRLQRRWSKKEKGSKNQEKLRIKLARKHYKIANIRLNNIHQITSEIVKKYDVIVVETLKPANMIKNRYLAKSIHEASFGKIINILNYKCTWNNKQLIKADMFYASSKICSGCGNKKQKLKLSERTYTCKCCGLILDRDLNAARNLASLGTTSKFEESEACGELSSVNLN